MDETAASSLKALPKTEGQKLMADGQAYSDFSDRIDLAHTDRSRRGIQNAGDFHVLVYELPSPSLVVELIAGLGKWIGKNKSITGLRDDACERLLCCILVGALGRRLLRSLRRMGRIRRILRVRHLVCKKCGRDERKREKHPAKHRFQFHLTLVYRTLPVDALCHRKCNSTANVLPSK